MSIILTKYGNVVAITTNTNKVFYMSVKQFLNAFSLNARGPEHASIITNGTFTGNASGWTLGDNWDFDTDHVVHTPGETESLLQAGSLIVKKRYFIRLNIGGTVGTVTINFGGNASIPLAAGIGAKALDLIALNNDSGNIIEIVPSSDFDGTIDSVSVKPKPYLITLDTDRLDEQNIDISAWTIAGNSDLSTVAEVGNAIADLVQYAN